MSQILIVTEDPQFISTGRVPGPRSLTVVPVPDFETALHELSASTFAALIIDRPKGTEGIAFIKRIRATPQLTTLPILVAAEWGSGYGSLALSCGADAYEPTPCNVSDLLASLKRLLTKRGAVAK
jgi:DNA-binding response OmpR family regulator